jgi:arylamine N-acetyltransferase
MLSIIYWNETWLGDWYMLNCAARNTGDYVDAKYPSAHHPKCHFCSYMHLQTNMASPEASSGNMNRLCHVPGHISFIDNVSDV